MINKESEIKYKLLKQLQCISCSFFTTPKPNLLLCKGMRSEFSQIQVKYEIGIKILSNSSEISYILIST